MKKLVALFLVLGLVTVANAALTLSVSDTELSPSDTAIISISGDGQTPGGSFYLAISAGGPGTLDISGVTWSYVGDTKNVSEIDDADTASALGWNNPFYNLEIGDFPLPPEEPDPLNGELLSGIVFHCEGQGEVTITLFDGELNTLDSVVIQQIIPEPITLALLGLGGLFIRRK